VAVVNFVSAILIIRTLMFFLVGIFLLTAGLIAWHEVIYRKKNGLTLAMRDFCFSLGMVAITTAVLNFYAAFQPIHNLTFLIIAIVSVVALTYAVLACYRLAGKMLEGEDG
jgi:hypothetical protein